MSLSRKQQALDIALRTEAEWRRMLGEGEMYCPPVEGIRFIGYHPPYNDGYNPERYLHDQPGIFNTSLQKKTGRQPIYELARSLATETGFIDPELYNKIECPQFNEWRADIINGDRRGSWKYRMFYAREILPSPSFSKKGYCALEVPNTPYSRLIGSLSKSLTYVKFNNNNAGLGSPFFMSLAGVSDKRRAWFHKYIVRLAHNLASELYLARDCDIVALARKYAVKLYHIALTRAQGKGRVVINVSKIFNYLFAALLHDFEQEFMKYDWFFIGGMGRRLSKILTMVKSVNWYWLNEADDLVVPTFSDKKPVFLSADDSGFDHGVTPVAYKTWFAVLARKLSGYRYRLLRNLYLLVNLMPIRVPQGLMYKEPYYGILSGCWDTKPFGTFEQGRRTMSARLAFLRDVDEGLEVMNRNGEFRKEKQVVSSELLTICQLVWSVRRPNVLHASLPRVFRHLVELENFSVTPQPGDVQVVQTLYPLFGHPKFKEACAALGSYWDIRTPSVGLLGMIRSYGSLLGSGGSNRPDKYELVAIGATIKELTGVRVSGLPATV